MSRWANKAVNETWLVRVHRVPGPDSNGLNWTGPESYWAVELILDLFFPPISGMLQMLEDTELDITQQDYVRTAQTCGKALVSLINGVLDQAKIESGKLELEAVPFDLRAVLDDVLSLFSGKAQDKRIEVSNKFPFIIDH